MENRLKAIDILRGIAICCMIIGHIHQRWTWGLYETWFGYFIIFIGLWSPPFFVLISGISFYIMLNNRIKKNLAKSKIINEILKRSFFLFTISTLFNVFLGFLLSMQAELTFGFLYWSIFQLISVSMLAFFFLPFLRKILRIILYASIYIGVFLLNHLIIYYNILSIYFLVQAAGPFPFLPWANMFLLGVALGDLLINISPERLHRFLIVFMIIGISFFIYWLIWGNNIKYLVFDRFIEGIGLFLMLFSIFYYVSDIKGKDNVVFRRISKWGNFSLTIYYYHFVIILFGLILFPLIFLGWSTKSVTVLYYILLVALVFTIVDITLRLWKKFDYKYGLEWFMRKFSQNSIFKKNKKSNNKN